MKELLRLPSRIAEFIPPRRDPYVREISVTCNFFSLHVLKDDANSMRHRVKITHSVATSIIKHTRDTIFIFISHDRVEMFPVRKRLDNFFLSF